MLAGSVPGAGDDAPGASLLSRDRPTGDHPGADLTARSGVASNSPDVKGLLDSSAETNDENALGYLLWDLDGKGKPENRRVGTQGGVSISATPPLGTLPNLVPLSPGFLNTVSEKDRGAANCKSRAKSAAGVGRKVKHHGYDCP